MTSARPSMIAALAAPATPIGIASSAALAGGDRHLIDLPPELWGFGGAHGGLVAAIMLRATEWQADDRIPRSITTQLHHAVRAPFGIDTQVVRSGRTVHTVQAVATAGGLTHASASISYANGHAATTDLAPPMPPAPAAADCERFALPVELVPFSQFTELRPVGPARPGAGGSDPVLTAWIRLTEDDRPPGAARLVVLLDSLAPSYAAILDEPVPIPTLEYAVRFGAAPGRNSTSADGGSPWVLVRAETLSATGDWIDERIDAWSPDGHHLASATQVRLVMQPR